jgi:hypothetical protein
MHLYHLLPPLKESRSSGCDIPFEEFAAEFSSRISRIGCSFETCFALCGSL